MASRFSEVSILSRLDTAPIYDVQAGEICYVGCASANWKLNYSFPGNDSQDKFAARHVFFFPFQIVGSRHLNVFSEMEAIRFLLEPHHFGSAGDCITSGLAAMQ